MHNSDEPVTARDILMVIVAYKLRKPLSDILPTATVKALSGGKSTLQNEILGDLAGEFGNLLNEKMEEVPIEEIASLIQPQFNGRLGKVSSALVNKLVGSKMAGGFGMTQVKQYLSLTYGLGPQRIEACLLYSLVDEPSSRLGTEAQSKAWLDKIAKTYGGLKGIQYNSISPQSNPHQALAVNSKDFEMLKQALDQMVERQFEASSKYLGFDRLKSGKIIRENEKIFQDLQLRMDMLTSEHGDAYLEGIIPIFDHVKARTFDSYWNWIIQDLFDALHDIVSGKTSIIDKHLIHRICNSDDDQLIDVLSFFIQEAEQSGESKVVDLLEKMLGSFLKSQKSSPKLYLGKIFGSVLWRR